MVNAIGIGRSFQTVQFLVLAFCTFFIGRSFAIARTQTFEKESNAPPNFVILFADDIGWGDFGANWAPNKGVTPNLDQLAAEGLRLTDFHAGASICAPSRAALLTGRLGVRNGVITNFNPKSTGGLPLNETTVAEVLKDRGYYTGMIGKWHLGMTHKFHPRSRGFDFYHGLPYSNDMGCIDGVAYNKPMCKECLKHPKEFGNNSIEAVECGYFYTALPLYDDYNIVEQPADLTQLGNGYAEKAQEFIETAVKSKKPFLLYMAFAHMHVPLAHDDRFTNSTNLRTVYSDTLHELDDVIGRVVKSLKQSGVYDNTLTWFTGDNGPWSVKCEYGGSPGPFLGSWQTKKYGGGTTAKASTWEAGHREPTVVVWPGVIEPNTTSDSLTSALDIFPTLLSLSGAELPPNRKYDGIDLTEFFQGKTSNAHYELFHPNSGDTNPIGEIDTLRMGPYKVFWKTGGHAPDCSGKFAPQLTHEPPLVFDVEKDPAETTLLTKETTANYDQIITNATNMRNNFLNDVKHDNTSRADFSTSMKVLPCCDPTQFYCRCKRDSSSILPLD